MRSLKWNPSKTILTEFYFLLDFSHFLENVKRSGSNKSNRSWLVSITFQAALWIGVKRLIHFFRRTQIFFLPTFHNMTFLRKSFNPLFPRPSGECWRSRLWRWTRTSGRRRTLCGSWGNSSTCHAKCEPNDWTASPCAALRWRGTRPPVRPIL